MLFLDSAVSHLEMASSGIAGYAIITWDNRGNQLSSWWTGDGPIGEGMLAQYLADAINRRIACDSAVREVTGKTDDEDEPA